MMKQTFTLLTTLSIIFLGSFSHAQNHFDASWLNIQPTKPIYHPIKKLPAEDPLMKEATDADKYAGGNYRTRAIVAKSYASPGFENDDSIRISWRQGEGYPVYVEDFQQNFIFDAKYTSLYFYSWNAGWTPGGFYEKIYNNNGRLLALNLVGWNGTNYDYAAGLRFYYNTAGRLINRTEVSWNGTAFDSTQRSLYTYNSGGRITRDGFERYIGGVWENDYEYLYEYNNQADNVVTFYNEWNVSVYDSVEKYLYTYNTNDSITEFIEQDYIGGNWENQYRTLNYYNPTLASRDSSIEQNWVLSDWENDNRFDYLYFNNLLAGVERKQWDNIGSTWDNDYFISYQRGPENRIESLIYSSWNGIDYINDDRMLHFYGGIGERLQTILQSYNGLTWDSTGAYYYHFDYDVVGVDEEGVINLQAFPNPFTDNTAIRFVSDKSREMNLVITDLSGKVVFMRNGYAAPGENMIFWNAASNLASGTYVYQLRLDDKAYSGKLIKQ